MILNSWPTLAAHPATVRRALVTSLFVGTVLTAINHGPAILQGTVTGERIVQMLLTFVVPYVVSTVSSVSTRREMESAAKPRHVNSPPEVESTVGADAVAF